MSTIHLHRLSRDHETLIKKAIAERWSRKKRAEYIAHAASVQREIDLIVKSYRIREEREALSSGLNKDRSLFFCADCGITHCSSGKDSVEDESKDLQL
jgi:hypothetical protein